MIALELASRPFCGKMGFPEHMGYRTHKSRTVNEKLCSPAKRSEEGVMTTWPFMELNTGTTPCKGTERADVVAEILAPFLVPRSPDNVRAGTAECASAY